MIGAEQINMTSTQKRRHLKNQWVGVAVIQGITCCGLQEEVGRKMTLHKTDLSELTCESIKRELMGFGHLATISNVLQGGINQQADLGLLLSASPTKA